MRESTVHNNEYSSCTCEICRNACNNRPGWFVPEQVPEIEAYFAKKLSDFLGKELAIDWGNDMDMRENILLLAPNIEGNQSIQYPANPRGKCVFFKEGRCAIYSIRPYECGVANHMDGEEKDFLRHVAIASQWKHSTLLDDYKAKIVCYQPTFDDLYGTNAAALQNKYLNIFKKHPDQQ